MRSMNRLYRWAVSVAAGGVTFGILQAVSDVNFNSLWFEFLTTLLSVIVAFLFGGDASQLGGGSFGA